MIVRTAHSEDPDLTADLGLQHRSRHFYQLYVKKKWKNQLVYKGLISLVAVILAVTLMNSNCQLDCLVL